MRTGCEPRFRAHSSQGPCCGRFRLRVQRAIEAARSEEGFTLVEVLVVAVLLTVVLALLMAPLDESQQLENRQVNYAAAQQQARTGLDSMVAQIRGATAILASGSNFVQMDVNLNGSSYLVQYKCDVVQDATHNECVRTSTTVGGTLPPVSAGTLVASNLLNGTSSNPVFSWGPDPNAPYYMTATIAVPASNGASGGLSHSIVFTDGALMRNLNVYN
jgi:type II secretory pathway pseudopilin PulG